MNRKISIRLFLTALMGLTGTLASAGESVAIRTASVEVVLSTKGGVPIRWDIVDPDFIRADRDVLASGEAGIALIDAKAVPLELEIPGDPGETEFLRSAEYAVRRDESPDSISITLTSPRTPSGLVLEKTYRIPRSGFTSRLELQWSVASGSGRRLGDETNGPSILLRTGLGPGSSSQAGLAGKLYSYLEVAERTDGGFKSRGIDPEKPELVLGGESTRLRWAGLHDRYFLFALMGDEAAGGQITGGRAYPTGDEATEAGRGGASGVSLELSTAPVEIAAGSSSGQAFTIYAGPKQRGALGQADAGLDDVLYNRLWGWLRWLCFVVMGLLDWLHSAVPNWGLSLILLAVVVRILISPVAHSGLRAQAKINAQAARIQPELDRIKAEIKDAAKRHEETMRVYREHNMSPFGAMKGCLWLLFQIPIFVALFNVIGQAYELRGVEFLWIRDLAEPDRLFPLGFAIPYFGSSFNLLPVLMAVTQVWVGNIASGGTPKQVASQRRTMLWMAVIFFVLFYTFPAGLVLYWMFSNLGQFAQQKVMERIFPMPSAPAIPARGPSPSNAANIIYKDDAIGAALASVVERAVGSGTNESTGSPVHVMAGLARTWPGPLDGPVRSDLEAVIRKIEVAKKVRSSYRMPGWKKDEEARPLTPVEWELLIATLLAYGVPDDGASETERGLAVKCVNAACRALDLAREEGGCLNAGELERWAGSRLDAWKGGQRS